MIKWKEKQDHCPVEVSMDQLSGKWKCLMLWRLNEGTKRYKELERIVPAVSQKMLTQQLKELEKDGLILRTVIRQYHHGLNIFCPGLVKAHFPF